MSDTDRRRLEERVIVLAPTAKDAALARSVLERAGVACVSCLDLDQVCGELEAGVGAVLVPEEAVASDESGRLAEWLAHQPPWFDLPVLILALPGADSAAVAQAMDLLGNVTVLERPMRVAALVSAVRTALRARRRQYELRDHLKELQQTELALMQSRSIESTRRIDFETLMQAAPAAIWVAHDPQCRLIMGNRAAARMMRVPERSNMSMVAPDDEVPRNFRIFQDGRAVPTDELPMQRAVRLGEAVANQELEFRFEDGSSSWAYGDSVPLWDARGVVRGGISIFVDITERRQAEEALRQADRRKDEFLAILAHELRNPLAPIRNSLHILRLTGLSDPTAERIVPMMERQVDHMVRLVDDLLEVSRITRGMIELRKEPVELSAVVRNAVETSRPLIEAAGHRLFLAVPPEPLTLRGDPVRLAQILANLLNNAAKYTDAGGRIWLTVEREGEEVAISVRDTGSGIPSDMLSHVFDLFTQIDQRANRAQGGLGIGLTLVKTLVEAHGGNVWARSEGVGKGSEFVVRLPLAPAQDIAAGPGTEAHESTPLPQQRVMVVDDNRDAAESMGMLLNLLGADTHVVYSGPDALEALATYKPSVVLMDIGMSGMDGHEVARRIRQQSGFPEVTLIALTGWGQAEDRRGSQLAGFDYHLMKPADIRTLHALLLSIEEGTGKRQG